MTSRRTLPPGHRQREEPPIHRGPAPAVAAPRADVPSIAVSVHGLTKRYGAQLVVDDLSFDVTAGRVVGFLGPNGAGKSTTLRMIVGLTAPTAGSSTILGVPYRELDEPARAVGTMVDGIGFHAGRRAVDELRIAARAAGLPLERCAEVLELVGLAGAARKRVGHYSLGMRQRLGIAQALLGDPTVLILDEPANGLDPEGILWVRGLLRDLADDGRAVLVSSHLLGEVARFADEVVVIRGGRYVTQAPVDALGGGDAPVVRVASRDDVALARVLSSQGAEVVASADELRVRGLTAEDVGRLALEAGLALHLLRATAVELEDVFMELTAGGGIA